MNYLKSQGEVFSSGFIKETVSESKYTNTKTLCFSPKINKSQVMTCLFPFAVKDYCISSMLGRKWFC